MKLDHETKIYLSVLSVLTGKKPNEILRAMIKSELLTLDENVILSLNKVPDNK